MLYDHWRMGDFEGRCDGYGSGDLRRGVGGGGWGVRGRLGMGG